MPPTSRFLERYRAGEYEAVWQELMALGSAVRQEPLLSDARAVADQTMRRVRENLAQIFPRLERLGYRFANKRPWVLPDATIPGRLAALEAEYGPLPLSLHAWFSIVGEVDLTGYHPMLSTYASELGESECITYADPLVVSLLDEPWDEEDDEALDADEVEGAYTGLILPFAPCFFHKSNYSGSGGVSFRIPDAGMDAILQDDAMKWTGRPFIEMIRVTMRWGGFPGFEDESPELLPTKRLPRLLAAHELSELTAGLLPL